MHTSLSLLLLGRRQKFLKSLVALDGEGAVDAPFMWNVLKYSNLKKICLLHIKFWRWKFEMLFQFIKQLINRTFWAGRPPSPSSWIFWLHPFLLQTQCYPRQNVHSYLSLTVTGLSFIVTMIIDKMYI